MLQPTDLGVSAPLDLILCEDALIEIPMFGESRDERGVLSRLPHPRRDGPGAWQAGARLGREGGSHPFSDECWLWMPDKGRYGQYLYGRVWPVLSPRSEALGEALSALFEIPSAAHRKAIMAAQPLRAYGIPTVYPDRLAFHPTTIDRSSRSSRPSGIFPPRSRVARLCCFRGLRPSTGRPVCS